MLTNFVYYKCKIRRNSHLTSWFRAKTGRTRENVTHVNIFPNWTGIGNVKTDGVEGGL